MELDQRPQTAAVSNGVLVNLTEEPHRTHRPAERPAAGEGRDGWMTGTRHQAVGFAE